MATAGGPSPPVRQLGPELAPDYHELRAEVARMKQEMHHQSTLLVQTVARQQEDMSALLAQHLAASRTSQSQIGRAHV